MGVVATVNHRGQIGRPLALAVWFHAWTRDLGLDRSRLSSFAASNDQEIGLFSDSLTLLMTRGLLS